jgi:hypothetical protein
VVEVCEVADIRFTIPRMAFVKIIRKSGSDRLRITQKKIPLGIIQRSISPSASSVV